MKIILGITTVLLLAVFTVAYLYFSNLTGDSRSNSKTLAAIPADASVVLNFSNDKSLYEIFKDYTIFDGITGNRTKQELHWLKSLFLDNRELAGATQGQKVFLSFHPMTSDSLNFLWVMPILEDIKLEDVEDILQKQHNNRIRTANETGISILEITNTEIPRTFYIGIDRSIVRGSFSKPLLVESLDNTAKKLNKEFIKEINNAVQSNNDALASLFINHNNPGFLNVFFKENPVGNFGLFGTTAAFSSLNLNYKSDALMFNGLSQIKEQHDGYLNLFLKQQPVKNTIKKIIPYNLSNAICFGLSDYEQFNTGLKRLFGIRKEIAALDKQIQLITNETGVNPDRDIKKLWGNEFCNIQLSTYENLAIIRVSNGRQLKFFFEPLSASYSEEVRKMNYENIFYYYFGDPLKKYNKPFFAVTDNLAIISNSPGTVQRFLNDYNNDRFLSQNTSFNRFDQLVADQSNISFLLQLKNSGSLLKTLLKKEYSDILESKEYRIKNFYGISYQLTSNTDHFFTNFYTGYENATAASADTLVYNKDN
ncbi:hypothetical protein [Daejeonella sp.]|uniref:hypothetical protein n=1 Tax=Daejeonella sp. TaxID=2805397 RepID=UPI003982EEDE